MDPNRAPGGPETRGKAQAPTPSDDSLPRTLGAALKGPEAGSASASVGKEPPTAASQWNCDPDEQFCYQESGTEETPKLGTSQAQLTDADVIATIPTREDAQVTCDIQVLIQEPAGTSRSRQPSIGFRTEFNWNKVHIPKEERNAARSELSTTGRVSGKGSKGMMYTDGFYRTRKNILNQFVKQNSRAVLKKIVEQMQVSVASDGEEHTNTTAAADYASHCMKKFSRAVTDMERLYASTWSGDPSRWSLRISARPADGSDKFTLLLPRSASIPDRVDWVSPEDQTPN